MKGECKIAQHVTHCVSATITESAVNTAHVRPVAESSFAVCSIAMARAQVPGPDTGDEICCLLSDLFCGSKFQVSTRFRLIPSSSFALISAMMK